MWRLACEKKIALTTCVKSSLPWLLLFHFVHLKPVKRTLVISHHQAWRFVGGQAVFVEFLKHTRNPLRLTISVFEVDPKKRTQILIFFENVYSSTN